MILCTLAVTLSLAAPVPVDAAPATKVPEKHRPAVDKGLAWLAKQQERNGRFSANGGQYPIVMTALAGLAFLAEGSTPDKGKYSKHIADAADWLLSRQQPTGLFGNSNDPAEQSRYMIGQGYAMLFLSQVYLKEPDKNRKAQLKKALERAGAFAGTAQTTRGGWGYVAAIDGSDFDEGCCTFILYHALLAMDKAGIEVGKAMMDRAKDYAKKSTIAVGTEKDKRKASAGVVYSLASGGGVPRPALTAMALCCAHLRGDPNAQEAVQWLNYTASQFTGAQAANDRLGQYEFTHFYMSQAIFKMGEEGHGKLRPDLAEETPKALVRWTEHRALLFDTIAKKQSDDGSFTGGYVGPVYQTAVYLVILQLDNEQLPCCRR
jgi:hypothetical protein